jgi:hypothetical protein
MLHLRRVPTSSARRFASLAILIGLGMAGLRGQVHQVMVLDEGTPADLKGWEKKVPPSGGSLQVVQDEGRQVIRLRTESASLSLDRKVAVNLKETPFLEWEWKVTALPTNGNFTTSRTDDQAGQLLITFPRGLLERRKVVAYLWDTTAAKGTMADAPAPIFLNIKAVIVESGSGEPAGKWVSERRNLLSDCKALFGSVPDRAVGIRIQANSQHTRSEAEAFWRSIRFTSS